MSQEIRFPEKITYYIGKPTNRHKIPSIYGSSEPNQLTSIRYNSLLTYDNFTDWQTYLSGYGISVELDSDNNWYKID